MTYTTFVWKALNQHLLQPKSFFSKTREGGKIGVFEFISKYVIQTLKAGFRALNSWQKDLRKLRRRRPRERKNKTKQ